MKIVIATAVYYPQINGVAVFSHNLALGLARRGHEVMVICPSQTGKGSIKMEDSVKVCRLKSIDVKVYPDQIHKVPNKKMIGGLSLPRLFYRHGLRASVFPQIEVKKLLSEFQPDVVHIQVSDPIGLSVASYARRHKIPVVTTEHNQPEVLTDSLKMPRLFKRGANVILSSYFRNRQNKSDFVTMPTEQAILNLLGDFRQAEGLRRRDGLVVPIAAISNGVDLTHFKPGKAPNLMYEKYGIDPKKPIVLYVGRLDPEKRVGLVIEAFKKTRAILVEKRIEPLLVLVGDGTDKANLEKLVVKLGLVDAVKFLGKVLPPDLYEIYRMGWVFVTASPIETQGIVLIEAAACGLPLIAVNKGAVAEICKNGGNGYLCEVGNEVGEMTDAMVDILTDADKRKKYAAKSIEIAGEHDFEKTLDKFINIYKKVVEKSC